MLLGLGPCKRVDTLEIHWPWPSKRVDIFKDVTGDRYITIVEGEGIRKSTDAPGPGINGHPR